jgi:hypothetical protein
MGQHGHSEVCEVVVISQREREEVIRVVTNIATWRRSCGDGTRRRSTEAIDGSPMERWFQVRGGYIGARVGAVDNVVLSLRLL